jgi:hypothetical protein
LLNLSLGDGSDLVAGEQLSAFTKEDAAVGLSGTVPSPSESTLIERGARFTKTDNFAEHTIADQRLVTGRTRLPRGRSRSTPGSPGSSEPPKHRSTSSPRLVPDREAVPGHAGADRVRMGFEES